MDGFRASSRRSFGLIVLLLAVCAGTAASLLWVPPATGNEAQVQTLAAFMRKKLDASSKILEGITTEDDALIAAGADALLEMSKAEMWNVITDEDYREFNRDFRSSVRKLKDAAEKGNFDNATLQWIDSVKSCVECHKYIRSQRPTLKN
uniref:Cytochrome c n=1 Tax=Schlesneria paludicola TaxID=360056 RepID=A0A7C2P335_9PLAN